MRQLNRSVEPHLRAEVSARIIARIEALKPFSEARTVALFSSLPDEPDTTLALERWSYTKQLVVPRVEGEVMHFYPYHPEQMALGSFGIHEPQQQEAISPKEIDLMVVPGVAFTPKGARCGRGKGFYDKYLSQLNPACHKVGICYRHQLLGELPTELHDICMEEVIAE